MTHVADPDRTLPARVARPADAARAATEPVAEEPQRSAVTALNADGQDAVDAAPTQPAAEVAGGNDDERPEGRVIAIAHGYFEVVDAHGTTYLCTLRGRLRKQRFAARPLAAQGRGVGRDEARGEAGRHGTHGMYGTHGAQAAGAQRGQMNRRERAAADKLAEQQEAAARLAAAPVVIAPGDRVRFTRLNTTEGVIEDTLPRATALTRARSESGDEHVMLANLDHAALVFAVREPEPHPGMLDRYLALCEQARVEVTICFNKTDLGIPEEVARAEALYNGLGYTTLETSAATGAGLEALRARLQGRVSLLTGPSGVGKSSLTNALLPTATQRTGDVSEATGKGRHTTTGVRLLPLPEGGWLADSAGIRELALWNVPASELPMAFRELRPYTGQCLYDDCTHSAQEDGCALQRALAEGHITPQRFVSFERLLAEARTQEAPEW